MKTLRLLFQLAVVVALGGGYLGSQYYYICGKPQEWAALVDTAPIVWASLLILLGAIALALIPEERT